MKRRTFQRVIPSLMMAGATAIPVATTVEILTHVTAGSRLAALPSSAPVTVPPPRTSSHTAGASASTSSGGTQTYQGPVVNDPFGGVQATVTIAGKKITNVVIAAPQDNPRSAGINQQAIPLLRSETLQAQSAQIQTISGATLISEAYAQSLQAALDQARGQGNAVAGTPSGQVASAATAGASQPPSVSGSEDD
jgi:uncharacterized protein with FMN-binding domain